MRPRRRTPDVPKPRPDAFPSWDAYARAAIDWAETRDDFDAWMRAVTLAPGETL